VYVFLCFVLALETVRSSVVCVLLRRLRQSGTGRRLAWAWASGPPHPRGAPPVSSSEPRRSLLRGSIRPGVGQARAADS
jgi:hypothetical protein